MMNTTIVLLCAAESDASSRELTHLGILQADRFTELVLAKQFRFDRVLVAAHEADSWLTTERVKELTSEVGVKFLRDLPLRETDPYFGEVVDLMKKYPNLPTSSYHDESGHEALEFHARQATREVKQFISPMKQQHILICSRHAHVLSEIALTWVRDLALNGYKLCPPGHLPSFPVTRDDLCFAAMEFCLNSGQGLTFRYDASNPGNHMVGPIQRLIPSLD